MFGSVCCLRSAIVGPSAITSGENWRALRIPNHARDETFFVWALRPKRRVFTIRPELQRPVAGNSNPFQEVADAFILDFVWLAQQPFELWPQSRLDFNLYKMEARLVAH
jgi:hypothetical protein